MLQTKSIFNELTPSQQLIVVVLLWIGCLGMSSIFSEYIQTSLQVHSVGMDVSILQPRDINILRYTQILGTILGFLLPSLLYGFLVTRRPVGYFFPIPAFDLKWLFFSIVLILSIYPLIGLLAEVNNKVMLPDIWEGLERELRQLEALAKDYVVAFMDDKSVKIFVLNLIMIAVIPAICEEFFFRGVIQRISYKIFGNFHIAILFSAFLFAFSHFEFYTFLPRLALGLLLGYMYYYTGSLIMPIFTHFLNNGTAVLSLYLSVLKGQPLKMDIENSVPILFVCVSTMFFIIIYFYFVKSATMYRQQHAKNQ